MMEGSGARILMVDDDLPTWRLYERELGGEGWRVRFAARWVDAARCLRAESFDVVIMDLALPDLGGLDAAGLLARTYRELPLIIHSAYALSPMDFASWAIDEIVIKSSDVRPLKDAVRRLIRRPRTTTAGAAAVSDPVSTHAAVRAALLAGTLEG